MKLEIVYMAGVAAALSPPLSSTPSYVTPTIVTSFIPLPSDQVSSYSQTGCPTVTSTRELCASCPVPACLYLSTVTQSCGCPTPVPTVYLDFPCKDNCKNIWCSSSYAVVTQTGCSATATSSTPSSSATDDCTTDEPSKPPSSTKTVTSTKTETTTDCTTDEPEPSTTSTRKPSTTEDCTTDEPESSTLVTSTKTETTTDCTTDEPEESTSTPTAPTLPPPSTTLPPPKTTVTPAPNGTLPSTTRLPGSTVLTSSIALGGVGRMRPFWGLGVWF